MNSRRLGTFVVGSLLLISLASCGTGHGVATLEKAPPAPQTAAVTFSQSWLHTAGTHVFTADNQVWAGHGVNLFDTRGCGNCLYQAGNPAEVIRRLDILADDWKTTLIRFDLESYNVANGRTQWGGVLVDAQYLADIKQIVDHAAAKPNLYLMITLLVDPSFDDHWIPTAQTPAVWSKLAQTFANYPNVLFGVANEPHANSGDSASTIAAQPALVWKQMSDVVTAIRVAEDNVKAPHHVVAVQGTTGWSRDISYYVTHPINSDNIVYEVHPYDPPSYWQGEFTDAAMTLPVYIGEFGPWDNWVSPQDVDQLMATAEKLQIPYTGWAFHWACGISMLQQTSADTCGVGAPIVTNAWGTQIRAHLQGLASTSPPPSAPTNPNTTTDPNASMPQPAPPPPADPAPATSFALVSPITNTHCVDVTGWNTTNGTAVELWTCNNQGNQTWTWSGKTLRSMGKCLDDPAFNTANGTGLILWDCNGGSNQNWELVDGSLRLAGTHKCVDISAGIMAPGAQLILWDCHNGANQKWNAAGRPN